MYKEGIDHFGKTNWWWDGDPYRECQNSSPSVQEFIDLAAEFGHNRIKFIGYRCHPPRVDWRVTVEGFVGSFLKADEALELMSRFDSDEKEYWKTKDGYCVRFWWD